MTPEQFLLDGAAGYDPVIFFQISPKFVRLMNLNWCVSVQNVEIMVQIWNIEPVYLHISVCFRRPLWRLCFAEPIWLLHWYSLYSTLDYDCFSSSVIFSIFDSRKTRNQEKTLPQFLVVVLLVKRSSISQLAISFSGSSQVVYVFCPCSWMPHTAARRYCLITDTSANSILYPIPSVSSHLITCIPDHSQSLYLRSLISTMIE